MESRAAGPPGFRDGATLGPNHPRGRRQRADVHEYFQSVAVASTEAKITNRFSSPSAPSRALFTAVLIVITTALIWAEALVIADIWFAAARVAAHDR
jgi:hypothetical protein